MLLNLKLMIGNDLVFLPSAVDSNKLLNTKFLQKVFTPHEQRLINSEIELWKCWAAKEAAYKVVNRKTGERKFAPKSFQVNLVKNIVSTEIGELQLVFGEVDSCIHAICLEKKIEFSTFVLEYTKEINTTSDVLTELQNLIQYKLLYDDQGLPYIVSNNNALSISISHDAHVIAVVIPIS